MFKMECVNILITNIVANNNINNTKIIDETKNIEINGYIKINVVDNFKLLGVTIDNKLNFSKFINETC